MYIASSFISYGLVSVYAIKTQTMLGVSNITGVVILVILFAAFSRFKKIHIKDQLHAVNQIWAG